MTEKELVLRRMTNQRIVGGGTGAPKGLVGGGVETPKGSVSDGQRTLEALVGWMGCIQAQDYVQAKWAIGVRGAAESEAVVDAAFNEGRILRTHVLRPTWHFVLPSNIRWMLRLSAPRIRQVSHPYYKKLELDAEVFRRSRKVLEKKLRDGTWLTRVEIAGLFGKAKINTDDIRMNFLLMDAELEGLVCSGPRKGRQFTYALLEERASAAPVLSPEEAVGELAARYFASRGPGTLADFAWWSGLTMGQAKQGLEMVKGRMEKVVVEGKEFWFFGDGGGGGAVAPPHVLLLPAFDEFLVAYKDRAHVLPEDYAKETSHGLKPVVVVNGRVAGVWKREVQKGMCVVELTMFGKAGKAVQVALKREAERFAGFAGAELVIQT